MNNFRGCNATLKTIDDLPLRTSSHPATSCSILADTAGSQSTLVIFNALSYTSKPRKYSPFVNKSITTRFQGCMCTKNTGLRGGDLVTLKHKEQRKGSECSVNGLRIRRSISKRWHVTATISNVLKS